MNNDPFNFVLLINLELCRQNFMHRKAQTLLSNDVEYQDPLLTFARLLSWGKKKYIYIFQKIPKQA